jgi:phage terminase large subunit
MVTEVEIALNKGAQDGFFRSEEPFPAFMGGQGSGKTAGGVMKAWRYTVENPGSRGVWTEPVAAMFQESLLPTLRSFFGDYEGSLWTEQGKGGPNHRIEFSNGCLWMLKAAETPERLVGFEVAWALMNEAGSTEHGSQEQAYLNLVGRLRQKGFRHWLGIATTPSGYNWLWREWVDSPTAKETGHILFRGATSENAANLPDGYIERMTQTYIEGTPMYRQYVLGEFVQMEGLVLPNFDVDKHVSPWPATLFIRKIAGVDFGVQSATAIVECAVTQSGHRWMREWLYQRECDDETFVKACRDAMDDGITLFVCDPSGKDRIRWMNDKGIPSVKARSNRIEARVKSWITPLSQGMLTICNESQFLIREVLGLSWAKRRGRELETDKFDVNTPDHAFDAGADGLQEIEAMPIGWKVPELVELL